MLTKPVAQEERETELKSQASMASEAESERNHKTEVGLVLRLK